MKKPGLKSKPVCNQVSPQPTRDYLASCPSHLLPFFFFSHLLPKCARPKLLARGYCIGDCSFYEKRKRPNEEQVEGSRKGIISTSQMPDVPSQRCQVEADVGRQQCWSGAREAGQGWRCRFWSHCFMGGN